MAQVVGQQKEDYDFAYRIAILGEINTGKMDVHNMIFHKDKTNYRDFDILFKELSTGERLKLGVSVLH